VSEKCRGIVRRFPSPTYAATWIFVALWVDFSCERAGVVKAGYILNDELPIFLFAFRCATIVIRAAVPTDFETICALNVAEVQYTSAMDLTRLAELNALSCYHKVACLGGVVSAFLLAMCSGSPYKNANFEWFSRKYARCIYVDRVIVSSSARGQHLGSLLYEDLFSHARSKAIPLLACEYNLVPPNEPSRLFHDKFGFKEQGTRWVADGAKLVSLQTAAT
jgi:predicted GNAT superfamily acetyltransferase